MSELSNNEMRKVAKIFVSRSMRIGKKKDGYDAVRILYNRTDPSCEEFAQMVEEECWKIGAHTLILSDEAKRDRLYYQLKPEAALKKLSPFGLAIAKNVDVTMFIGEDDDPNWAFGLSNKIKLTAPNREKLRDILDRRKVRWAYFGWPIPGAAKGYGCSVKQFRDIFFESIRQTFKPELVRLCKVYERSLKGRDTVRIVHEDGTDLSFRIKGRPVLIDDGVISDVDMMNEDVGVNIPAGEVFLAPLEYSANGRIFFDNVSTHGFGKLKGLELNFKNGKVVKYRAEKGTENFTKFLKANTGEKDRIAEFGIGTNKGARYTGGSIIIDEKIKGTIHIAIGSNRGAYHGKNKASSHLDMIKDMRDGQVFADRKLFMDKGRPVA